MNRDEQEEWKAWRRTKGGVECGYSFETPSVRLKSPEPGLGRRARAASMEETPVGPLVFWSGATWRSLPRYEETPVEPLGFRDKRTDVTLGKA